jgi:hypothetical protein
MIHATLPIPRITSQTLLRWQALPVDVQWEETHAQLMPAWILSTTTWTIHLTRMVMVISVEQCLRRCKLLGWKTFGIIIGSKTSSVLPLRYNLT